MVNDKGGVLMAKQLKEKISNLFIFLFNQALEDIFILSGVAVILYTTYNAFGITIGNYLLSLFLLIFGILFARK